MNLTIRAQRAEEALIDYMTNPAVYDGHRAMECLSDLQTAAAEALSLIGATYVYESQTYHKARIRNLRKDT